MRDQVLKLRAESGGIRLDKFLARSLESMSRSAIQGLIAQGLVTSGEKPLAKSAVLAAGQMVQVVLPEPKELELVPENIPLDVAYEDGDLLVVNKPKGMVVHPAPGSRSGTLVNALLHHCGESLSGINGVLRPGIVHRIDKDTSGLLLVAKNNMAHQSLAAQIQAHTLTREYRAVAYGGFSEDAGTIDAPIGRHPVDRKKMAVDLKNGREAITHWSVLARYPGYTHIECRLETGRTHQIRVHLASIGHPLLGDTVYGAKKPVPGLAGQCLHARRLKFVHPSTGDLIELECPLPEWFQGVLQKIGR